MLVAEHLSFAELMNRLRERDQDAASLVFHRFVGRLIALARLKLDAPTQRKLDPEDVVQSAFRSFFTRYDAHQFAVASWDELWSLMTVITVRKCANQVAHFHARRRAVSRESFPESWEVADVAIERDPTASEVLMLAETVERLMRALKPEDRVVIELSLQGYSVAEISDRLDLAERSVRRLRERAKRRLMRIQSEEV
jgi:RNA polymerase sigma-70 factor, ECF subfamily